MDFLPTSVCSALGEEIAMISLSFFFMSLLWEDKPGRFALFAFKFVFRVEWGQK